MPHATTCPTKKTYEMQPCCLDLWHELINCVYSHSAGHDWAENIKVNNLTPTVSRLLKDLRPHSHCGVDDNKPECDQGNKVIELVRSVHYHTQHQHQEVQTEKHLWMNMTQTPKQIPKKSHYLSEPKLFCNNNHNVIVTAAIFKNHSVTESLVLTTGFCSQSGNANTST